VVLIHEGGFPTGDYNECPGISGPIVDIVKRFDRAVDVVVSGHTHRAYVCNIDGRLVAFTGDLFCAGGKLYQLHAVEYTYGSMEGVLFTLQSVQALHKRRPDLCLPLHGEPITEVAGIFGLTNKRLGNRTSSDTG